MAIFNDAASFLKDVLGTVTQLKALCTHRIAGHVSVNEMLRGNIEPVGHFLDSVAIRISEDGLSKARHIGVTFTMAVHDFAQCAAKAIAGF